MKKLKLITLVSLIIGLTSGFTLISKADETYGVYYNNEGEYVYGHRGDDGNWIDGYTPIIGAWHIDHDGTTGTPYIVDGEQFGGEKSTFFKSVTKDAVLSIAIERNQNLNDFTFGTYTYDKKGNIVRTTLDTVKGYDGETEDRGDGVYNTIKYDKNDIVGLWIKEKNSDNIYYSDNRLTLNNNGNLHVGQYTDGYSEDITSGYASVWFDIDNQGDWHGQEDDNPAEIKFLITGVSPDLASNSSGSPLPGVFVTLLISGVFGGTYLKRKKIDKNK